MVGCADEGDCVCYHQSTSSHYHRHQVLITAGVCAWIHHAHAHGIATRTPMALPRTCAWHCHARAHGVFTALVYFRQTCVQDGVKEEDKQIMTISYTRKVSSDCGNQICLLFLNDFQCTHVRTNSTSGTYKARLFAFTIVFHSL